MFIFGGGPGYRCYNTLRVFDTESNCWMNTPSVGLLPVDRESHSAFTYNEELYIFGGQNSLNPYLNDLWKYNPETFSWKKVEVKGKLPSPTFSMHCCMVGDQVILFGGDKTPGDLYVLDLSTSLKTLCKLAVIQYGLQLYGLPHNIRLELTAMTTNSN